MILLCIEARSDGNVLCAARLPCVAEWMMLLGEIDHDEHSLLCRAQPTRNGDAFANCQFKS
jgi:hypothetical protein